MRGRSIHAKPGRAAAILRVVGLVACFTALSACQPDGPSKPRPPDPPQVSLTTAETNVVGDAVALHLSVNGCAAVESAALLDRQTLLKPVTYQGNPTRLELTTSELAPLYPSLGIAADLSLHAEVTCDDGRVNTSIPVGVSFFPVSQVVQHPNGLTVTDSFYAEGSAPGGGPTFVGCSGTPTGTALVRVDIAGNVIDDNTALPFDCSHRSIFTERHEATGKRWMWEYGRGAFAFTPQLDITAVYLGNVTALTVGPEGDAVLQADGVKRVAHDTFGESSIKWTVSPSGVPMAPPHVRPALNVVALATYVMQFGKYEGHVVVETFDYETAEKKSEHTLKLIAYGQAGLPTIPPALFNPAGDVLYFPFQSGPSAATPASSVIACATDVDGCNGPSLRWQKGPLDGLVTLTLPFADGKYIAAVSSHHTWFLDSATGNVVNLGGEAILSTGSLVALGVLPGRGNDFYILNGPAGGFPTELVAVDAPEQGELVRYRMNGGDAPTTALTVATDDSGQWWLRIGLKLVKPMSLTEYRALKGPTVP